MDFDNFNQKQDEQSFNQAFREQFNDGSPNRTKASEHYFNQRGKGDRGPIKTDNETLRNQSLGFDQDYFNLMEPSMMTLKNDTTADMTKDSLPKGRKSKREQPARPVVDAGPLSPIDSPRAEIEKLINEKSRKSPTGIAKSQSNAQFEGEATPVGDTYNVDGRPKQNTEFKMGENTSSYRESDISLSNMAQIDGANFAADEKAHFQIKKRKKVKGFKQYKDKKGNLDYMNDHVIFSNDLTDSSGAHTERPHVSRNKLLKQESSRSILSIDFDTELNASKNFIDVIKDMKKFSLSDKERIISLTHQQGTLMFDQLADNLEAHNGNFDKTITNKEVQNGEKDFGNVKVIHGEKFEINDYDDFKQWERYDIVHIVGDSKNGSISETVMPKYLIQEVKKTKDQPIAFNMIKSMRSGQKAGRKLSNTDSRWVEKWYEIKCKDVQTSNKAGDQVVTDIIVKHFSKFWTNTEQNTIEGESCLQILKDGAKEYKHDALMFELWGSYKMENILDKHGSLKIRSKIVQKTVPVEYKVEKPEDMAARADQELDNILNTGTLENEGQTIEMFDLIPKKKPTSPSRAKKGQVPNSVPEDIANNFKKEDENVIIKYETKDFVVEETDQWTSSNVPFTKRAPKLESIKITMIQFDGSLDCKKVIEEGVEHAWTTPTSQVFKTGHWTARQSIKDPNRQVMVKNITYTDVTPGHRPDPNLKVGEREGVNEDGQFWKEDWEKNDSKGYLRWNRMTEEGKHLRQDGFDAKWGEWREQYKGDPIHGERWTEMKKEEDDYWERKTERFTEYPKQFVKDIDTAIDSILDAPKIIRSGISDFKNNRNYFYAEQWEEFHDGTLKKKIVKDNGLGEKELEEFNQKLNIDEMTDVSLVINEEGYFSYFINEEKQMYHSLQELMVEYKRYLEWEIRNSQNEKVAENITITCRKGQDYQNGAEWYNTLEYNKNDGSRSAKNWAKDATGEWGDENANKGRERWAKKKGQRGGQEWFEEWYKKCKSLPKKKDEEGNELDEYESDGDEIEEQNTQKWGKNLDAGEEWNEKWGEVHRDDKREKWCDKWQVDLSTGQKKGENWGQTYTENYVVIEHWAEKWDERHPENGGVYEKRREHWPNGGGPE